MQGKRDSARDRFNFFNTLTGLVKSMESQHTIIDLRNENCVSGLIKRVDGHMNVEMENVTFYDSRGKLFPMKTRHKLQDVALSLGKEHQFKDFYVSARNIRYVHIPQGIDVTKLMKDQQDSMVHFKVPQKPQGRSFKTSRALRYNQEIRQQLADSQPGPSTPATT